MLRYFAISMSNKHHQLDVTIRGMHCASCEVMIERKFKKVPGVDRVNVNHANGKARIQCSRVPDTRELQKAIDGHGYTVVSGNVPSGTEERQGSHWETGAIFLVIVAAYLILRQLKLVPEIGVQDSMSYGFVFAIGLVAAVSSCIAVTGGLLVAVSAKYAENHPNLTGMQRFKPNLLFNIGRIVGYTVLGGAVGALGSMLTLSTKLTGIITIGASLVMILLGFQLLHLFPLLRRFQPKMPKFLAHRIHDSASGERKTGPFLLGAATFFLPCGFTQALQLYVLSQGDWKVGALTMFVFSLGTLPALLSLSAISSFTKGKTQRYFLKTAGVVVLLLGISNIRNGIALAGFSVAGVPNAKKTVAASAADQNVRVENGVQVVAMAVNGYEYEPAQFTVQQGVPVQWKVDASRAGGCARVLIAPDLNIQQYLSSSGTTLISFTPQTTGTFRFSCPMGMTTPGAAITVVANDGSVAPSGTSAPSCDPEKQRCVNDAQGAAESGPAQKVSMSVSREQGFYPNSFTVKKDQPVEWTIDDKVRLGGCMGTIVLPDLGVVKKLELGTNTVRFTPTQEGRMLFTCSMGTPLGEFNVTS